MVDVINNICSTAGKISPLAALPWWTRNSFHGAEVAGPHKRPPVPGHFVPVRVRRGSLSGVTTEVGVQDERLTVELGVSQDGWGHQLLLHDPEGF